MQTWLPPESFTCPWCPTSVVTVESPDAARQWMEHHLDDHADEHFAQPMAGVAA